MDFVYKFRCSSCARVFSEEREEAYQRIRKRKLCKYCKEQNSSPVSSWVVDQGGFPGQGCGSCVHFLELSNGWGHCGLGYKNDNEAEYSYGKVYELVYIEDICPDREEKDAE
jgi:hypothetical protein